MAADLEQSTFKDAADEVEHRLHVQLVPGTEILTDEKLTTAHFIHGSRSDLVLVPQPTLDPNDPLNWSLTWKYAALIMMAIHTFIQNFTVLSIAPLTPIYLEYFHTSLSKVSLLTGACILTLGYSNFIIIPAANVFGRRIVSLICCAAVVGANIWQATATSYNSFIAARVFTGFFCGPSESIMPVVIADTLFLHERGTWNGVYVFSYFMGVVVGPVASGNMAAKVGWRWFFWLSVILQAVSFIGLFFLFPETKYRRENTIAQYHQSGVLAQTAVSEKPSAYVNDVDSGSPVPQAQSQVGQGRPSRRQRFGLMSPDREALKLVPRDVLAPIQLFFYPIVLWAGACFGFGANCLLVFNLLEAPGFGRPPYLFNPGQVGLTNLAFLVGGTLGLVTAGPLSDWVAMKLTRKNNGIREPEMRLPTFIPFLIVGFIGMLIGGLGWQRDWSWKPIVVVGFGFTGFLLLSSLTIAITYAVDSYKPAAGEIMVVATIFKNTFGFGMTYFVPTWGGKQPWLQPVMTLAALGVGIPALGGIVMWFFGKTFRRLTKNSKVHQFGN